MIRQMALDVYIRLAGIYAGTAARQAADFIAYRVFDFEGNETETLRGHRIAETSTRKVNCGANHSVHGSAKTAR